MLSVLDRQSFRTALTNPAVADRFADAIDRGDITTGSVFYVHSGTGSNSNDGTSPSTPVATLDYAVGKCTASKGDIIVLMPGHAETLTAAGQCVLDVAGITVVFMGHGSSRASITLGTAVGADIDIDAAGITLVRPLILGGFDALTGPLDINAADCRLFDIETRDVTGQATDFIVADDNADRLLISGWKHRGAAAAGADTAISIVGADDVVIESFEIYGNFAVAAIEQVTTQGNRHRYGGGPRPNYIWTENAADILITAKSDTTGWIGPNINGMLQDNAANITEAFAGAAMQFMQPLNLVNLAGEASVQSNITASTDA